MGSRFVSHVAVWTETVRFLFWNTSKGVSDVMINIAGVGQDAPEVCDVWNDGELLTVNGEDQHF